MTIFFVCSRRSKNFKENILLHFIKRTYLAFPSSLRHPKEQRSPKMTISCNLQLVFSRISAGLCDIQISHSDTQKIQSLTFHQGLRRRLSLFTILLLLFPWPLLAVAAFRVLFTLHLGTCRYLNAKHPFQISLALPSLGSSPSSQAEQGKLPGGDAEQSHLTWLSDTFLGFCSTGSFSSWNPSCASVLSVGRAKPGSC